MPTPRIEISFHSLHTGTKKTWSPNLSLVPRVEALASPKSSKRATPKAPRRMYNDTPQTKKRKDTIIPTHLLRYVYKHPKGRSRCFVFDDLSQNCQIPTLQNQSVQLRLFMSVCLIPPTLSRAFGRIKCHKVRKVIPYSQTFEYEILQKRVIKKLTNIKEHRRSGQKHKSQKEE